MSNQVPRRKYVKYVSAAIIVAAGASASAYFYSKPAAISTPLETATPSVPSTQPNTATSPTVCLPCQSKAATTNIQTEGSFIILKDVTAKRAYELIQQNHDNSHFIILDVRTPEEYAEGHIENALNLDYYSEDFEAELNKLDKEKIYLIYCRSGSRSGNTLEIMKNLEFTQVYNIEGGIDAWTKEGYPTVQ